MRSGLRSTGATHAMTSTPTTVVDEAPRSHLKVAYVYLLRVPIVTGIVFVLLPYLARRTTLASLLLGLFDVRGVGVWAVATAAFTVSLTIMTTVLLVLAYAHDRSGVTTLGITYSTARSPWSYTVATLFALPTLLAVFQTGDGPIVPFIGWSAMGLATALGMYEIARWLMRRLDGLSIIKW